MKPERFVRTKLVWCSLLVVAGCSAGTSPMFDGSSAANVKSSPNAAPFVRQQLRYSRVRDAREASEGSIAKMFRQRGISYPAAEMYVRVFKLERELELWVRPVDSQRFELLRTYSICALAGVLGPKNTQGDRQVPEGFYTIDHFNPTSSYHLSLRINYPNQRDRIATRGRRDLGGEIFIHGGCKSDGCLAITDEAIEELYWIAVMARGKGQTSIPVHIFPARLDNATDLRKLQRVYHGPSVVAFWQTLKPGYDYFQKKRQLPAIGVDARGRYRISEPTASRRARADD